MRLNRFLAASGLGSRRGVEELIRAGRVRINGRVVEELATQVGPDDTVKVGSRVLKVEEPVHILLNKPRGYVVSADDERDRKTVFELLPEELPRVFHVGRLDRESEGLLIMTNNGELSLALTHPRYKIEKEYEVMLDKPFDPAHREKLLRGFHIIGGRAKMEEVKQLGPTRLRVTLQQGIKRQIRLMLYELGYEVEQLVRIRIGPLFLGRLRPGEWRRLSPKDVKALMGGGASEARSQKPVEKKTTRRGAPD
jgi:23S rRNA pseudouridine2605 synthase